MNNKQKMKYRRIDRKSRTGKDIPQKVLHIVPVGSKWSVRTNSSSRARKILESKQAAIEYVKPLGIKGYKVAVHKKTGMVEFVIDAHGRRY